MTERMHTSRKSGGLSTKVVLLVAVACMSCVVGFRFLASSTVLESAVAIQCVCPIPSVGSEMLQTLIMFALGFLCSLALKHRNFISRQVGRLLCLVCEAMASAYSAGVSIVSVSVSARPRLLSFQRPSWINKELLAITTAGAACTGCFVGLVVSAFTVQPNAEVTGADVSSESSRGVRIFTVGWIFMMALKLRRELVGQIGDCYLLQPW